MQLTRLQVEAIDKAVNEVAKFDAGEYISYYANEKLSGLSLDDWFVITITDANFAR